MNQQERNVQTAKEMFLAVNRGDMQTVLSKVADNVDWQSPVTNTVTEPVSWAKPRKNRNEVEAFFKELSSKIRIDQMNPTRFLAQGNLVAAEGTLRGTVLSTAREYSFNWCMIMNIENGKIIRMRNYWDTADITRAFLMELRKAA